MSRLVGKGGINDDINTLPKLNITKDNRLIITADLRNPGNIKINETYTIISGFIITEDVKNKIIPGKNLDVVINYIDDENNSAIKTVTVLFKSFDFKVSKKRLKIIITIMPYMICLKKTMKKTTITIEIMKQLKR